MRLWRQQKLKLDLGRGYCGTGRKLRHNDLITLKIPVKISHPCLWYCLRYGDPWLQMK